MKLFLKENFWLKLASLSLAVFLWFFVLFRSQSEITVEVEPRVQAPGGFCVLETRPEAVSLTLKGNERILRRLKPSDIKIFFTISEAKGGKVFVALSEENIKLPPHIALQGVNPSGIWVVFSRNVKVTLPLKPNIIGLPTQGFRVERVEIFPEKAQVECAPRDLSQLSTDPVDISGANENISEETAIQKPEKGIKISPQQARVKVIIRRAEGQ